MPDAAEVLALADQALAANEWETAFAGYSAAVEAGAGPEALEGLAAAAWALDRAEAVFEARERAYTLYCEAQRRVDAARIAIALAWDYRTFRAEAAVGDGWLARARRLLEDAGPSPEAGWLLLREAAFVLPTAAEAAREKCLAAQALGRELGDVDLEMTALALEGLTLVGRGEIAVGMLKLDEATTAATTGEMRDTIAIGLSCCYLIFACERVRDIERAGQWCSRLNGLAEATRQRSLMPVCRTHFGTVLMLQGAWDRAEAEFVAAASESLARPATAAEAFARLAELRRRQGRLDEASALATQAEHHPMAMLCAAALALDRGDAADAADRAAQRLRQIEVGRVERAPALEVLVEACAASGRPADAASGARELRAIAEAAQTDPLLAAARHAEGRRQMPADAEAARAALEDAAELYGRAGLPFEAARARVDLAAALRTLRRGPAAERELERAEAAFVALGASGELLRVARLRNHAPLTRREREVLALVADGRTNAQIAAALVLSEHTVHRHVANILAKLGSASRAAAVARANELDLL
jgi:LuxR family transcriptional regulator, maltose regulon positive regulatory protein